MLRSMGLSLIGVFVPIYLYKIGYDLPTILLFIAGQFVARLIFDVASGYLVARFGPKHTILLSNVVLIMALGVLLTLPSFGWPLWLLAIPFGATQSLFFIAYHVDFSKIIHQDHGGKELGFMTIVERLGAALGPVIGGLIATFIGAEYTFAFAMLLLVGAVIPLFLSAEPVRSHQRIHLRGVPYRKLWRDWLSRFVNGMDNVVSLALWPLYVGVIIFTANTYAGIGFVTSLGVVAAILAARFIGQVVDKNRGRMLLNWSVAANSVVHATRPFVGSIGGVALVNTSNDAIATGYMMPYAKGMYARADELPGLRIAYIVAAEIAIDLGKVMIALIAWLLCFVIDPVHAIVATFIIVACTTPLMTVQNFPALKRLWP